MTNYDDARAAIAKAEDAADATTQALAATAADRDRIQAEYDEYRRTHPEVTPGPQPSTGVLMGMSTDDWAARVKETGPVAAHRVFNPSFSVSSIINKIKADHANGVTPYWSVKFPGSWADAAAGKNDTQFKQLGVELGKLDYVTYGSFHHEPRDSNIKTPEALKPWSAANARVIPLVRAGAGENHRLGTTDNGFPWGVKSKGQALTDAELRVYYTDALLAAVDFLGGDFYDGATNTNTGEPAAVKMDNFEKWAKRIGFDGELTVGEWNAVKAADIRAGWNVLKDGPWAIACLFNSAANNRDDLPSSLGGSWVLRGDRLAEFRKVLDEAGVPGR